MKRILRRSPVIFSILLAIPALWWAQSRFLASHQAIWHQTFDEPVPSPSGSKRFKIGTYNIAHGRGGKYGASNWTGWSREQSRAHLLKIAGRIKEANLDIVVLNEVDFDSSWSRNIDQAEQIARAAGYPFIAAQRNVDASVPFFSMRFGNAILSRYPLEDFRAIEFPAYSKWESLLAGHHNGLLCVARTPLGDIRIMAVHLEYRDEAIRVQTAKLIAGIAREQETPLIVLGDFNSTPRGFAKHQRSKADENAMDYLLGEGGFRSLITEIHGKDILTFPSEAPDRAIDWVLTTHQLQQSDRFVDPSTLSDHRMLSVVIEAINETSEQTPPML